MEELQGVIEAKEPRKVNTQWGPKDTVSFVIGGDTYSGGFKKWDNVNVGDEVLVTFQTTPQGYRNIKGLTVVAAGSGAPVPQTNTAPKSGSGGGGRYRQNGTEGGFPLHPLSYERALDRRNAVTAASRALEQFLTEDIDLDKHAEAVIRLARHYEGYTTGDLDLAEAKAMAGED